MPHYPVYGLDIETGHPSGLLPVRRDGATTGEIPAVDPRHSIVIRAVVSTAAGDEVFDGDEVQLLEELDRLLARLEPGILATWNGAIFDLPYLADRAGARAVHLGLRLAADPRRRFGGETLPGHRTSYRAAWHRHRHLDVASLYRSGRRPLIEVDELLRMVGLHTRNRAQAGIGPADAPGAVLSHDAVHAFASNDARLVRSLVESRLPGIARQVDRITTTNHPSRRDARPDVPLEPPLAERGRRLVGRISLSPAHPAVRAAMAADRG